MWGINDRHKYFSELFECQENFYFWLKQFRGMGSCPGADFMKSLLLQRYKFTSPFEGRGALKQWITLSINLHSILYLNSFKLGWDIESYYMKTVIWVSHLVPRTYQRLLKFSFDYVVHVHVNWMLRYLNNTRIVYCLPLPLLSHALPLLTLLSLPPEPCIFLSFSNTQTQIYICISLCMAHF